MSLKYTSKPIKISSNLWEFQRQMPTNINTNTNRGIGGVKLQIGGGANTAGLLQRRVLLAAPADICRQVKCPLCETVMVNMFNFPHHHCHSFFHLLPPTSPPRNPPDPPRPPELPWPPMLLPWIWVWLDVYQLDFISQAINSSSHCTWPPCPGRGEPLPWAPKWLISFSNLCLLWCSWSPKILSLDDILSSDNIYASCYESSNEGMMPSI